jgi:paraquat-inducible protein B
MTERERAPDPFGGVAEATVESRGRPSIVWLIPLVAALVGGFVAWRAFSARGPEITITFATAEGLEAGKTKIKYKEVEVGLVEEVLLEPDLSGVVCRARMVRGAEEYLTEQTQFWIVKPRVAGGQVTGLGTLLSGSYVGMDPVREGKRARRFKGLDVAPIVTTEDPGRHYVLRSDRAGALDVGSPVYFRRIAVGQVVSSELDRADDFVTTRIFVRAPYDQRVYTDSRFWNSSGIDVSIGADGVKVDTQSVASILIGGVAFDTPSGGAAAVARADAVFPLYENREAAQRRYYTRTVPFLLHFEQSVRGLHVGAPVEFRGIPVGEVTDVRLELDAANERLRIPVRIDIEPERFTTLDMDEKTRRQLLDDLVASGLRAQLKSGNLLTGQLVIALDIHENAKPAQIAWGEAVPELPTIPTPIEEITASLTQLAERLGRLPVEQIGNELRGSLQALRVTLEKSEGVAPALQATLEQADRALASTNALIGPDSDVNSELRRALLELSEAARALGLAAEQIQTQPSSLIFGKEGNE